jgi:hypothetical protein
VEAFPPEGFESYFGLGPYYRFIEPPKAVEGGSDVLERIRDFPQGATAEDQMRELMRGGIGSAPVSDVDNYGGNNSAQEAIDYLYRIMEEDGPFDGIIGYSEGATVAATLILYEQHRFETYGIPPMFKCALFFAGWPPMTPELDAIVLADESDLTITIPTCHISEYNHHIYRSISRRLYADHCSWIFRPLLSRIYCSLQYLRYGYCIPIRSRQRPHFTKRQGHREGAWR